MSLASESLRIAAPHGRGAFILFEGIDRCGKTTQSSMLAKQLSKGDEKKSELIRFPNRSSVIGQMINNYLTSSSDMSDQTIHLLFSANRWEAASGIEEKLLAGTTLVCDRYAYSGVAFSSAKGMDVEWCKSPDRGLPAPDAVIFLELPIEDATQRGDFGNERYEEKNFQKSVRERFDSLQKADEKLIPWFTLDARRTIDELHEEIKSIASDVMTNAKDAPIKKLWI